MNLYEFNKLGYAALPKMTKAEIEKAKEDILKFLSAHDSNYYMMLNHERKYFTVFTYKNKCAKKEKMAEEMIATAESLGTLKSIEVNNNILEFWIQHDTECIMYAIFEYEKGVIEIG